MLTAFQKHDDLLADIATQRAAVSTAGGFHLWWLGQSGFLIAHADSRLLFDPYLSDSLTAKYADTDKPHTRMTELVVDPARLDRVDVVTSSHNHTDHLDGETLRPLFGANPGMKLITAAANRDFAIDRVGCDPNAAHGIDAGESVGVAGFTFHAIPAAHDELERDEHGRHRFVGFVVEFGGYHVYHSGDTVLYEGITDWLHKWPIDLALLPINGRLPERRVAGNLWGREAAYLAKAIDAKRVVPCHYDMFDFNTETTDEFVTECQKLGVSYTVLLNGEGMRVK
ncbi:MAG: MBL fold metallo-hydrolase [Planctomycetota bacterium]|jgi:L-ascorbate metabolism protein UlaG (beta-lactamase superfamily)